MTAPTRPVSRIDLVAGRPSLDFVNTIHDRWADPLEDYLVDVRAWLDWSVRAGVLTAAERRRLYVPDRCGDALLAGLRRFRESLYVIFLARIEGRQPPEAGLALLGSWARRAWRGRVLRARGGDLAWVDATVDCELPAKRLALDAVELLQTVPRQRLKRCAAQGECGWLFLDDSRSNRRAWCDMNTCGAVAKMRRYRARAAGKLAT
jgi:predicted RNA-binding Zn ribbon-like protein